MPNLPPLSIPADAGAKAEEKAKTTDFYAELTDQEREEEGLPPRAKAETEGEKPVDDKPAPEPEKKEPEKVVEEVDDEEDAIDTERLLDEILGLRESVDAALEKSAPAKTEKEQDTRLKTALESEDDGTRDLAEQLKAALDRIDRIEAAALEARDAVQLEKDDAEFDAVQKVYLIDGKPMSDEQVLEVERWILKNRDVGRSLSIEQLTRVVFPTASRRPKSPPAKGPGDPPKSDDTTVATIVDQGSSGGAPSGQPFKPRPNETIESAVAEFGRRAGWKR